MSVARGKLRRWDVADAPFMEMPPDHDADAEDHAEDRHQDQSRVFDPRNRGNAERHDDAEQADLPGQHMHAGGEGAERQQGENSETRGGGGEIALDTCQQQHVHHDEERQPVQRLGHNQSHSRGTVGRALPAGADADQRDQRRQELPVAGDRLFRKTGIGDADHGQDQHQAERQLSDPEVQVPRLVGWPALRNVRCRGRV